MPILPIDLQVILMKMDSMTRLQHEQQDGVYMMQVVKGAELGELSQIESSRVNEVKPHPDNNTKIEDKKSREQARQGKKREEKRKKELEKIIKEFQEPEKGIHIDIKR